MSLARTGRPASPRYSPSPQAIDSGRYTETGISDGSFSTVPA